MTRYLLWTLRISPDRSQSQAVETLENLDLSYTNHLWQIDLVAEIKKKTQTINKKGMKYNKFQQHMEDRQGMDYNNEDWSPTHNIGGKLAMFRGKREKKEWWTGCANCIVPLLCKSAGYWEHRNVSYGTHTHTAFKFLLTPTTGNIDLPHGGKTKYSGCLLHAKR